MEITSGINIKSILSLENSSDSLEMEKKKNMENMGGKKPNASAAYRKEESKAGKERK